MPRPLVITLAILGFLALAVFGVAVIVAIQNRAAAVQPDTSRGPIFTRDAFRSAVFQEGAATVLLSVGKPDRTITIGHNEVWYYNDRIRDTVSGRLGSARVHMALGRVCDEVDFD